MDLEDILDIDNNNDNVETDSSMMDFLEESNIFQKEVWQFRVFPYYEELKKNADFYFSHIKTGLSHSILHRDLRPGFIYWVYELERFIQIYSWRFTKVDHINLVNLLYSVLVIKKLDYRVIKIVANTLKSLLNRKNLLKRGDIVFEWRPLYNLYIELDKDYEDDGLLIQQYFKKVLSTVFIELSLFFSNDSTQEILNEVRPMINPWNETSTKLAFNILRMFLPTALTREEHDKFGASLWVDELWHWCLISNNSNLMIGDKILSIFARLVRDCPGYIDWTDKYDELFSRILRSFKVKVGSDRVTLFSSNCVFNSISQILVYSFNDKAAQDHLDQLFSTLKSYFYPSNNGNHSSNLLTFIFQLSTNFMHRVSRERHRSELYVSKVPPDMCLTDEQIDKFVKILLPCLKYAAFSKVRQELVPSIMRILAFLSPGIIIPAVLNLIYPALETVTEPHRLTQSLYILSCICIPLVRDDPTKSNAERHPIACFQNTLSNAHLKSYRCQALSILLDILPGIDVNDTAKSILTFQIIGTLLLLIPVVDCSEAPLVRTDLTEEEKELCSATACFDSFIEQLLSCIFKLIEMIGHSVQISNTGEHQNLSKDLSKCIEELVIEKGVVSVVKALVRNCNSTTYKTISECFFNYLKETIFDSKIAMDTLTRIATIIINTNPVYAFPLFFKFATQKLFKLLTEEVCKEEEIDVSVTWYLTLVSKMMRSIPGFIILENREELMKLLNLLLCLKSIDGIDLVGILLKNILHSLCSIYIIPENNYEKLDLPFDQYLPIRNWAETINKKTWKPKWHVPTDVEVDFANELIQLLIFDNLKVLENPESLTNTEILNLLTIINCSLEGCSNLLPYFDGDYISVMPTATPNVYIETIVLPSSVKLLTASDGTNLRKAVFYKIKQLVDYMLLKRENDTKSLIKLVTIIRILSHVKGVDGSSYMIQNSSFRMTKKILSDPICGNNFMIKSMMETMVEFMHLRRQLLKPLVGLTETHLHALKLLFLLGTSSYSVVRIEAQKVLDISFTYWIFSYQLILDDILNIINNHESYSHEQFKGALYMLLNGKEMAICVRQDWAALNKIWPAIVKAHFSEKPSVILLLETAHEIILPESIIPIAQKLVQSENDVYHKPVWPMLTQSELENAKVFESRKNEENIKIYHNLCNELLKLTSDNSLHWRHAEIAQSFLSLLFRRDISFNNDIVLFFFKSLVSDSIKTRFVAISFAESWLKVNKPKALKKVHLFEYAIDSNNGINAKWPIKYGYRKDNEFLLYDCKRQVQTSEKWDSTCFFFKSYFGFYTWPKEFKCYCPPSEQININRTQFNDFENSIIKILNDDNFMEKMINFLSLEEKKGKDDFNPITFSFFYRLFRNFNTVLFPILTKHLEKLFENKKEGSQRLASEIVAGLVCGSKLWDYKRIKPLWDWLIPRLLVALENIDNESMRNWGTCLATISGSCEVRQVDRLTQALFSLVLKPCENNFHVSARLYFLHCYLNQFDWRAPELLRKLYTHCISLVGCTYQNTRYRIASCIALSILVNFLQFYVDPALMTKLNLVTIEEIAKSLTPDLNVLKQSVLNDISNKNIILNDSEVEQNSSNNKLTLKKEKLVFLALVDLLYIIAFQINKSILNKNIFFELIPILAHYTYEINDEDLHDSCESFLIHNLGTALISHDKILFFLEICELTIEKCVWWKTKTGLLRFLQVFVFTNIFFLRPYCERIQNIILKLIADERLEVRTIASQTLSGLFHCSYLNIDFTFLEKIKQELLHKKNPLHYHASILTLSAIIQAFPYSVPPVVPDALMMLAKHAQSHLEPIHTTVKQTLNEFKRTHQDCWHEHKKEFTEEQLNILTDLLISPSYYI